MMASLIRRVKLKISKDLAFKDTFLIVFWSHLKSLNLISISHAFDEGTSFITLKKVKWLFCLKAKIMIFLVLDFVV